jgi:site-specific DNA recombinase
MLYRDQAEFERLQERLDMIYEDRLDGRIDASTYDQKAAEIRERKERVKRRVGERQAETLPTATQAVELLAVMSKAADLFLQQSVTEQRKLLRLVLELKVPVGKAASCGCAFGNRFHNCDFRTLQVKQMTTT